MNKNSVNEAVAQLIKKTATFRIVLPVVLVFVLFLLSIFFLFIPSLEKHMMELNPVNWPLKRPGPGPQNGFKYCVSVLKEKIIFGSMIYNPRWSCIHTARISKVMISQPSPTPTENYSFWNSSIRSRIRCTRYRRLDNHKSPRKEF